MAVVDRVVSQPPPIRDQLCRRKAKKEQERRDAVEAARVAEQKKSGGRGLNALSGRDLFSFDPTLFIDDAEAAGEDDYQEDEDYWNQVLNENQKAIDKANREAKETRSDDDDQANEDDTQDGEQSKGFCVVGTESESSDIVGAIRSCGKISAYQMHRMSACRER